MKQKAMAMAQDGQARVRGRGTGERRLRASEWDGASRQLAMVVVWLLLGLVTPRAGIYGGLYPFGVSFASAVPGAGALAAYIGGVVGYLLPGGAAAPIRYIAALIAVAGIKWSLSGIPAISRHPLFAPLVSMLSVSATGMALSAAGGIRVYDVLLAVAEGLLAAGSSYFFAAAVQLLEEGGERRLLTAQEQASLVTAGAVVLMAAAGFTFSGISLGRMVAVVLILLLARCGKEQGGSIAGIVLGLAMAMSASGQPTLAVAYAFGGLMAGIFARFGRFASAGAFVVANLIAAFTGGSSEAMVVGVYEVAGASIIFVALPAVVDRKINRFFGSARDIPAVEGLRRSVVLRLDYASRAMSEVAQTVDAVSHKLAGLSAPDLGTVYRSVSDDVCRVCGLRMHCWENHFSDTMAALNDLTPVLREKGKAERQDVSPVLSRHCGRLDDVLQKINAGYIEYAVREGAWRRLSEIRAVVTDQFSGMSELLGELAEDFSQAERADTEAAARVTAVCEEYGLSVQDAVCLLGRNDRMTVEILASDAGVRMNQKRWLAALSDACGRDLDRPVVTRLGDSVKIALAEKPQFRVTLGSAQLHCTGERLCGDAFETFTDGAGKWYAVLSDGMGSGGRAAVDGAMASGLTSRLIQAGFGPDSVLRMVNSALLVKSGDESLSTLDIVELDLFDGKLESRKAGAAPSLLCSMGRVSRIERSALPVGILRDIQAERSEDTLVDGDLLLLFSDGAMAGGLEWMEETLRQFDPKEGDVKALAEEIAAEARKRQETREDDVTVLAVQIHREASPHRG
ncbi:MAG TPA: SpoIIE family protein phosphatase [Firmicutes bacterium]|nr:SpoIIE family protein phosphatase [Bacillota bacterium]